MKGVMKLVLTGTQAMFIMAAIEKGVRYASGRMNDGATEEEMKGYIAENMVEKSNLVDEMRALAQKALADAGEGG